MYVSLTKVINQRLYLFKFLDCSIVLFLEYMRVFVEMLIKLIYM